MKYLICTIAYWVLALSVNAQKIVEKNFSFSGKNMVLLNLEIADSIRIITWDKTEVYFKASVDINNNKNNDDYKINFDESGTDVRVRSNFDFKNGRNCCGDSDNCQCNCNCHSKIFFDLFLPKNADFSVETIDGNITISGVTAQVRAHSISGFIDFTATPDIQADLKMNTISGTMYSNFDFSSEKNLRHIGGNSINTILNGGGERSIDLETISGDIFFRKKS
jgi:hypothetical protein